VAQQPSLIGAAAQFGPRFNVVSFLPNAALLGLVLVLVASGAPSEAPNLADLKEALKGWSPLAVTGALLGVVVLSLLLHPFQLALVRLLEGYWASSAPGRPLAAIGIELHRRRYERLRSAYSRAFDESNSVPDEPPTAEWTPDAGVAEDPNRLLMLARWREARHGAARADIVVHDALDRMNDYPARDRLLPTRLGNALRAGEDEAGDRYGLATNTMFPRLYPILSDRFGRLMDDARDQLDMTARLCVTLLVATVASTALLATHIRWLLLPAGTALLAWVAYRAAVRTARTYGVTLGLAFDLHRFDMLKALHHPLPANPTQELLLNRRITRFFQEGREEGDEIYDQQSADDAYEHPEDEAKP
jgi:hypothetical protein